MEVFQVEATQNLFMTLKQLECCAIDAILIQWVRWYLLSFMGLVISYGLMPLTQLELFCLLKISYILVASEVLLVREFCTEVQSFIFSWFFFLGIGSKNFYTSKLQRGERSRITSANFQSIEFYWNFILIGSWLKKCWKSYSDKKERINILCKAERQI